MLTRPSFRSLAGSSLLLFVALGVAPACGSADDGSGAPASCSGLDTKQRAQATLRAYAEAVTALRSRALDVEAKFLSTCNAINADLGLDTSKTTAADACAVLNQRVKLAAQQGVVITPKFEFNCHVDLDAQAKCEGSCQASADCDVMASCRGGDVVVECDGQCSGRCDVTAPDVDCHGSCQGTCSANIEGSCMGECTGTCDAPSFDGTCDAGCSAGFNGTCEGSCKGTCDGNQSEGSCSGLCKGTCSGKATGHCDAQCKGDFHGGECHGTCSGQCAVSAAARCDGTCNGTCSVDPGSAKCQGTCHGECDAAVSPPTCTGKLDCEGSAECHASCQAQASAQVDCPPPHASVVVQGDVELWNALAAHIDDFAEAVNLTIALKDPIADVAGKSIGAFEAVGDVGLSGAACMTSSLQAAVEAQASISVSVQASASIQAG